MLSTHRLLDVFVPQHFLQLLSFLLQVGALGPRFSGWTLALHGIGSFAKGKVPHRGIAVGVNHKKLHPRVAVKSSRRKKRQTCLLPDTSWLGYTCDCFLSPLLALGEGGNDATQIISIALRETPELAAHSVAL